MAPCQLRERVARSECSVLTPTDDEVNQALKAT